MSMDKLHYLNALIAKHIDTQISLLMTPAFNNCLHPSLVGNIDNPINMGLKGMQLLGNSMMPLISYYSQNIGTLYPTHAEQFNQNINSQGYNSAMLAYTQTDILRQYLCVALFIAIQAVDLRAHHMTTIMNHQNVESIPTQLPLLSSERSIQLQAFNSFYKALLCKYRVILITKNCEYISSS